MRIACASPIECARQQCNNSPSPATTRGEPDNVKDDVLVASTTTSDERFNAAGLCVRNLGIELPAVIDDPDNHVERAYTGWPDRLYVIDTNGKIAYKSKAGPFGFKPEEVESTLKSQVSRRNSEAP